MLEQFLKSVLAYLVKIEPANAYVQSIPVGVRYPCYLLNKCDVNTRNLNSYYFVNTVHPYIRCFGKDELDLRNKVSNLVNSIFEDHCKIPILNQDGTESKRFIRLENIETVEITVDQNDVYCFELNFDFDTTHTVNVQEFELLLKVNSNYNFQGGE